MSLTERQMADLVAYADGTLSERRRARVEARLDESPELRTLVEDRRAALAAERAAAESRPGLRERAAAARPAVPARPALRLTRRGVWAIVLGVLGAVALVLVLALPGDVSDEPFAVQAAELGTRPATGPGPPPHPVRKRVLDLSAAGVLFPRWDERWGWQATGLRADQLAGRRVVTVFYTRGARRLAYSIVEGAHIPPPVATTDEIVEGIRFRYFLAGDRRVVTFLRQDVTCLVSGTGIEEEELVGLAAWRGGRPARVPF